MRKFVVCILTILIFLIPLDIHAETYTYNDSNEPSITSTYAFLMDAASNQVLYEKNAYEKMYPASMTKVMTTILAIETIGDVNQTVYMEESFWNGLYEADASLAGFSAGEEPTVLDLLYGSMLPSGAEAVVALACTACGSVDAFVEAMNAKAQEIGMTSTHFTNPTGLHNEDHYSTAYDIAILFQYALQNETFKTIADSSSYTTGPLASHPEGITFTSTFRPLINTDEEYAVAITGFEGGKTGFTNPAGRCLVSHASANGMECILVTGQAESLYHIYDAATVYNYYLTSYAPTTVIDASEILASYEVKDTFDTDVLNLSNVETVSMDLPEDAVLSYVTDLPEEVYAPITEGEVMGTISVYADDQVVYTSDLVATSSYSYSSLAHNLRLTKEFVTAHPVISIVLVFLMVLVLIMIIARIRLAVRRAKRKRRRKHHNKNRKA